MVALFGPSDQDLERLRSTVQSLGTTSVPGLAAALSWRSHKVEKLLSRELARPGTPLVYEPARRVVRWTPPSTAPTAPSPAAETPAPAPAVPLRAPRAPSPVLTSTGLKTLCPHCHVPLLATGSTNLAVCPECGRLASPRTSVAGTSEPQAGPAPSPAASPKGTTPAAVSLSDRRAQEMFAAYVTAKPIPCPKCRTPLRHKSVSEYSCPGCGQLVRFPTATPETSSAVAPLARV
ncbi:MAG: hypothetical protein ABSB97_00290 [Thermoplasmata archaeon]|jgi:uncharacterized Zn finger protein (UPF0148 family)